MAIVSKTPQSVGASWQAIMQAAIRDGRTLCRRLQLDQPQLSAAAEESFPVFAPEPYVQRMRSGDPRDPLLLQVLPAVAEEHPSAGFSCDPVGDLAATKTPGLLQKYAGRALLIVTGACAIHCRYCFRRHFPYPHQQVLSGWQPALDALRNSRDVEEVILSGGDPLVLSDQRLAEIVRQLGEIDHLRRLRVHTRLPIVIPQRVTDALIGWLRGSQLTPWMVVHANHPAEIDAATAAALQKLVDQGIPVLNQAVLLAGINDDADTLCELSKRLIDCRVTPYYLHELDRVAGAGHFQTPPALGPALIEAMRRRLPGYAVPRLVRETAGEAGKQFLA